MPSPHGATHYAATHNHASPAPMEDALTLCEDAQARSTIARATGITEERLESLAGIASLLRIKGVSVDHAALLFSAGVRNASELACSSPGPLADRLAVTCEIERSAARAPSRDALAAWVGAAQRALRAAPTTTPERPAAAQPEQCTSLIDFITNSR